jgi:flagellar biosynthetic protein FliO
MRLSPSRSAAAGVPAILGLALLSLALSAIPAQAAAKAKAANPENLPIPEGSAAPTALSGGAGGTLLRLGLGLVVVVGLISLVWYVMKRIQRSRYPALDERGPSLIDVVTTTSLGPNRSLHLVRVGDEIVLVGSTDHSVNIVARIGGDDAALIEDVAPLSPAFGRSSTAVRGAAMDDRERAVATATEGSLVERLRAMTTRH